MRQYYGINQCKQVITDNVTADRRGRMNCDVCRATLSAQIHPHAAKLTEQCFTV